MVHTEILNIVKSLSLTSNDIQKLTIYSDFPIDQTFNHFYDPDTELDILNGGTSP